MRLHSGQVKAPLIVRVRSNKYPQRQTVEPGGDSSLHLGHIKATLTNFRMAENNRPMFKVRGCREIRKVYSFFV